MIVCLIPKINCMLKSVCVKVTSQFHLFAKEKMLTLSWLQAPSRKPPAWQVLLQASKPMSHLEGNNFLMWSHLMLISLHQHPPSSSHIPEVWPKTTHPAVQAQSPKVQRNPASLRPRDRARISKSFIVLDAPKVGYQVFLRKLRRRLNFYQYGIVFNNVTNFLW